MIKLKFRKKTFDGQKESMNEWFRKYRTGNMDIESANWHADGTRTWIYWFESERDAVIFKLSFA